MPLTSTSWPAASRRKPHIVHDRNDNGVEDDGDARIRCKAPRSRWNLARPPACWRSPPCPMMRRTDRRPCCAFRPDRRRAACSRARMMSSSCAKARPSPCTRRPTRTARRRRRGRLRSTPPTATPTPKARRPAGPRRRHRRAAHRRWPPGPCCCDRIPAHTRLVSGSLQTAIAGARRLWHAPGDAPFSYRSSEGPMPTKWPSRCRSQRNQSLRMGFSVRVDDDHAGRVDNVGVLNFHAAASPTACACSRAIPCP